MTSRRVWLAVGALWDLVRFFLVLRMLGLVVRGAGGTGLPWLLLACTGNLLVPAGLLLYLLFPLRYDGLLGLLGLGKALEVASFALLAASGRLLPDGGLLTVPLGRAIVPVPWAAAVVAVLDAAVLVLLLLERRAGVAAARDAFAAAKDRA